MKDDTCFSRDERPLSRKIKNFFEHSWWPSVVSDPERIQCPLLNGWPTNDVEAKIPAFIY
jgi:hypothetical protein